MIDILIKECAVEASEVEDVIEEADKDKNGKLDKIEFEYMWNAMFGD